MSGRLYSSSSLTSLLGKLRKDEESPYIYIVLFGFHGLNSTMLNDLSLNNNTHKSTFRPALIRIFMFLLVVGMLSSCQNESSKQSAKIILPNTPETVCRAWQTYLDNNEIAKAMLLGNLATKNWLKENQDLFLADEQLEPTSFLTMICKEAADTAICKYRIQEEDVIEDYFTLVREKGQWLIVIEEVDSNDPAEKAFEEMKKRLDL